MLASILDTNTATKERSDKCVSSHFTVSAERPRKSKGQTSPTLAVGLASVRETFLLSTTSRRRVRRPRSLVHPVPVGAGITQKKELRASTTSRWLGSSSSLRPDKEIRLCVRGGFLFMELVLKNST